MQLSIIIPTYNRSAFLHDLLICLAYQDLPEASFDVIVVDDGSRDETGKVAKQQLPFQVHYIWQQNQGDAAARNTGVRHSQSDLLVFLDDDMLVSPNYLAHLCEAHQSPEIRIVTGTEEPVAVGTHSVPADSIAAHNSIQEEAIVAQSFVETYSRNMSIRRDAYLEVGMMSNLGFAGSSMWCDIEFAYRAHLLGYKFWRSTHARCFHRDHVIHNLDSAKRRSWEAARRAVVLFQRYPELRAWLPMFSDKTSIDLENDSLQLIARKLLRQLSAAWPALWSLEQMAAYLAKYGSHPHLSAKMETWVCGGYIYRGFHKGLREFGGIEANGRKI